MSTSMSQMMPKGISQANLSLRQALRRLWMDHTVYTRLYITSAFANIPDAQAMAERLLRNQDEIGNAVVPFYGGDAGKKLADLLRQHILIAVDVVSAAKANDKNKLAESDKRWVANADEIAAFLSSANPNWPKKDVEDLLHLHLQLIKDFVGEHMANKFPAEIKKLDEYFTEGMLIADTLSEGIIKQFPNKF
jgi:hypothetical protein